MVARYKQLERQIKNSNVIAKKIDDFKYIQKHFTIAEAKNKPDLEALRIKYNLALDEVMEIPVFNEYINLQKDVNNLVQQVAFIIEQSVNE